MVHLPFHVISETSSSKAKPDTKRPIIFLRYFKHYGVALIAIAAYLPYHSIEVRRAVAKPPVKPRVRKPSVKFPNIQPLCVANHFLLGIVTLRDYRRTGQHQQDYQVTKLHIHTFTC